MFQATWKAGSEVRENEGITVLEHGLVTKVCPCGSQGVAIALLYIAFHRIFHSFCHCPRAFLCGSGCPCRARMRPSPLPPQQQHWPACIPELKAPDAAVGAAGGLAPRGAPKAVAVAAVLTRVPSTEVVPKAVSDSELAPSP